MNWSFRTRAVLGACGMLALLPMAGEAQAADSARRKIGLVGFGVGMGALTNGTSYEDVNAGSFTMRISGGGERLRLAINLDGALGIEDHTIFLNGPGAVGVVPCTTGCAHIVASILVGAEFHPTRRGLYATSGVGFAFEKFIFTGEDNQSLTLDGARGLAVMVGAGYDLRVSGRLILTPFAQYVLAPKFETAEATREGASMHRLSFGLSAAIPGSGSH